MREVAVTPHARVLEAIDRVTGERVALKLLAGLDHEGGRDAFLRFEREARALAQLRHPHVVPLRAYHPEGPAIVLAWMAGGSLAERLLREPFAPARAVEIIWAVLSALGEAHRLGILHRDVKPTNVLFDDAVPRASPTSAPRTSAISRPPPQRARSEPSRTCPRSSGSGARPPSPAISTARRVARRDLTGKAPGPVTDRLDLPAPSGAHLKLTHDALVARLLQDDPRKRPSGRVRGAAPAAIRALAYDGRETAPKAATENYLRWISDADRTSPSRMPARPGRPSAYPASCDCCRTSTPSTAKERGATCSVLR